MEFKIINTNTDKELKRLNERNTGFKIVIDNNNTIWIKKTEEQGYKIYFNLESLFYKETIIKSFEELKDFINKIEKSKNEKQLKELIRVNYLKNSDKMKITFDLNTSFKFEIENIIIEYMECQLIYNIKTKKTELKKATQSTFNDIDFINLKCEKFKTFDELHQYLINSELFTIERINYYLSDVLGGSWGKINNLKIKDLESVYKLTNTLKEVLIK